jgi:predicted RNA-binding protein with RPS1 domain
VHENSQETANMIDTQDVSGALEATAETMDTTLAEAMPVEPAPEASSPDEPHTPEPVTSEAAAADDADRVDAEAVPAVGLQSPADEAVSTETGDETAPTAAAAEVVAQAEDAEAAAAEVVAQAEDAEAAAAEVVAQAENAEPAAAEGVAQAEDAEAAATDEKTSGKSSAHDGKRGSHGARKPRKGSGHNGAPIRVIPPKKVVKVLSVGMETPGVVRRVADFGAFVDIGVGTDGLVHVSEMSVSRVAKASDLLKEGDEVTVWIKELDRDRNRISLTMVAPGTKTVRDLQEGDVVRGKVTRVVPYAAFVDVGVGREGMLHIREMAEGYVKRVEDVVNIGDEVEVRIIGLDRRRQRIDLSVKGLVPEPVYESAPPVVEAEEERPARERPRSRDRQDGGYADDGADRGSRDRRDRRPKNRQRGRTSDREEWYDYKAEDEDMGPTAMALALQAALANEPMAADVDDRRNKKSRRDSHMHRDEQEEIINRTLRQHRQPA